MSRFPVEEDIKYERQEWRFQHISYGIWAVLLILVMLGFTGSGPVSRTQASSGSLRVDYERFSRLRMPNALSVSATPHSDKLKVIIDKEFLKNYEIQSIVPEPDSAGFDGGDYSYEFKATPGHEVKVIFGLDPNQFGKTAGKVEVEGAGAVQVSQTIYP